MQSVTNNTEAQRLALQNLMQLVVQLRDENKVSELRAGFGGAELKSSL